MSIESIFNLDRTDYIKSDLCEYFKIQSVSKISSLRE